MTELNGWVLQGYFIFVPMSFLFRHIYSIIDAYQYPQPLHLFLKAYYAQNKQLGSRDRKAISEAVFVYYRWCRFVAKKDPLNVLLIAKNQQGIKHDSLLRKLEEELSQNDFVNEEVAFETPVDFPSLSDGLSAETYFASLRTQPLLFVRLRKEFEHLLPDLENSVRLVSRDLIPETKEWILGLENGTNVLQFLPPEAFVVQDHSSQQILLNAGRKTIPNARINHIWDVCCGAGGKTIMAKSLWPQAAVLATDIRGGILKNLQLRLKLYGIKKVTTQLADMRQIETLKPSLLEQLDNTDFDLVIADVPCSGSGTWARNPEQMAFFNQDELQDFTERQKQIALGAMQFLKSGTYFLYITCSVFRMENEEVTAVLALQEDCQLIYSETIDGTAIGADIMYCALFRKQ